MPKKIAKIMVDGTEMNKCPLCGQGVNVSAWNKWKMCIHCHKLSQQGLNLERIKRIRATELSGEILTTDEDSDELSKIYSKQEVYNFRNTFPPGVRIVTRNKSEANYVKEVYNYYAHYGDNVPELNVLISSILQAKLDLYRSSDRVSEEEIPYHERKGLKEIDIKLGDQINKTTRVLEDLKDRIDTQAGNILTSKFGNMLQYLHDHEQEYMGVGICKECNSRVIFKTNFPTFKTWLLEIIKKIEEKFTGKLDDKTVKLYSNALKKELDDKSLAKTYIVEHIRQLEASMIEQGIKNKES